MSQKSLIAILGVIVVILIGTTVYFATVNKTNQPVSAPKVVQQPMPAPAAQQVQPVAQQPESNNKSSFQSDEQGNFYGTLVVTGYPIVVSKPEPFCEENCKNYSYVFFQVLNTDSKALFDFLKSNEGNSFVGDKQLGIGCVQDKTITYFNDSNELRRKEFNLSTELSKKILNSSKEVPTTIKLEKLLSTGGGDAPACYSHFTYVSSQE